MLVILLPTYVYHQRNRIWWQALGAGTGVCPSLRVLLTQFLLLSHTFSAAVLPLIKVMLLIFAYEFQFVPCWWMLPASLNRLLIVRQRVAHIEYRRCTSVFWQTNKLRCKMQYLELIHAIARTQMIQMIWIRRCLVVQAIDHHFPGLMLSMLMMHAHKTAVLLDGFSHHLSVCVLRPSAGGIFQ